MAQMNTDTAVLSKEAANFERIAGELRAVTARVESIAGGLAGQWHGQAGQAAQAALVRFHEAAGAQVQYLNEISGNIHTAGAQYAGTDQEHAQSLAARMGDSMGGPFSWPSTGTAGHAGNMHATGASGTANGHGTGVRLVSNIKQNGGPAPSPQLPTPTPVQPQIGPFQVPSQVAAAAGRLGAPAVPSDPAAILAPLDMPDPAPPFNVAPGTPLSPPPSPAGAAAPKCSVYDATKALLEPAAGLVGILTAAPEAATGAGVPIALAQIAGSTAMVADGLDAAEKCLG